MERPHSLSFQADSLVRSGSISFGRFETESLSWERRSSFSHNRYLEEVEKFSKPGSVIEKKAYFEAHFKKKALLLQNTSLCQDGAEHHMHENNMSDGLCGSEETEHANNVDSIHFDENADRSEFHEECQSELMKIKGGHTEISYLAPQVELPSNNVYCAVDNEIREGENTCVGTDYLHDEIFQYDHFDESSKVSGCYEEPWEMKFEGESAVDPKVEMAPNHEYGAVHGESQTCENNISVHMCAEIEYNSNEDSQPDYLNKGSIDFGHHGDILEMKVEGKNIEFTHHELQVAPTSDHADRVELYCLSKQLKPEKAQQTETERNELHLVKVDRDVEVKQNLEEEAIKDVEDLKSIDASYKTQKAEENGNLCLVLHQDPSLKETKRTKPLKKFPTNLPESCRSTFDRNSKDSAKILSRKEAMNPPRRKQGEHSSQISALVTHSRCSALKAEEFKNLTEKLFHEIKREKESRVKKLVAPRPSTPEKFESRERQTANRSEHLVKSNNQGSWRSNAAAFNGGSDDTTERRKQESDVLKTKLLHENKREKECKEKKVVVPRPSTPQKFESQGRLTMNRPKQIVNPTDQDTRRSPAAFNFNCAERAERRKEFYVTMEGKMHAKEAEINHIQAKTQEKTGAEMKQFRRSLNFKAKPMPSFYQEVALRRSDHSKAAASANARPAQLRSPSSNPRSKSLRAITPGAKGGRPRALAASVGDLETNKLAAGKIQQAKTGIGFQKGSGGRTKMAATGSCNSMATRK